MPSNVGWTRPREEFHMDEARATRTLLDGDRVELRFERRLSHTSERVWRMLTDPDELAHWFPARIERASIEGEWRIGAELSFVFTDVDVPTTRGAVLEFDPPKVLSYDWDGDVLRFELVPEDNGCLLVFTHRVNGGTAWGGSIFAAQHAAGWDVCLNLMRNRLEGADVGDEMAQWFDRNLEYVAEFGLAEGIVLGVGVSSQVSFVRALVQSLEEVWTFVTEGTDPTVGGDPPLRMTNPYVAVGPVTEVVPLSTLAYTSGEGMVRLHLESRDFGCVLRLAQTVPARSDSGGTPAEAIATYLAAWQTHLEVMISTLHDRPICPWPTERTDELERMYRDRLAG